MKKKFYISLVTFFAIGFYSCSNPGKNISTDNTTTQTNLTKEPIDTADARLAKDLSIFCTLQVKTGELASTKASTQKIKNFGNQCVELYTKLGNSLNLISEKYNIKLPAATTPVSARNMQELEAIKGATFDHAYLLQLLKQHNVMIREINAAKNIQCSPLKLFVISNQADIIRKAYASAALKDK